MVNLRYEGRGTRDEERSARYEVRGTKYEERSTRDEERGTKYEGRGTRYEVRRARDECEGVMDYRLPDTSELKSKKNTGRVSFPPDGHLGLKHPMKKIPLVYLILVSFIACQEENVGPSVNSRLNEDCYLSAVTASNSPATTFVMEDGKLKFIGYGDDLYLSGHVCDDKSKIRVEVEGNFTNYYYNEKDMLARTNSGE